MNPIVSPWIIYLIETLSNLKPILSICIFIFLGICFVLGLVTFIIYDDNDNKNICSLWYSKLHFFFIVIVVSTIINTCIPSKETMYTMLVANYVTIDNINMFGDGVKNTVDYVMDSIDQLINSNEEKKD